VGAIPRILHGEPGKVQPLVQELMTPCRRPDVTVNVSTGQDPGTHFPSGAFSKTVENPLVSGDRIPRPTVRITGWRADRNFVFRSELVRMSAMTGGNLNVYGGKNVDTGGNLSVYGGKNFDAGGN
jgi:hypothetical protein